jgi:hypothetical protein
MPRLVSQGEADGAGQRRPGATPAKQSRASTVGDRPPQPIPIVEPAIESEHVMTMRTTKSTVTFVRPFRLGAFGEQLPAGRYPIETDEELLEGVSFPVYRRTATMMQLIADPLRPGIMEIAVIDPEQLAEALAADAAQAPVINVDPPKVEP